MIPIRDSQYRLTTPYVTRALIILNILVWLYTAFVLSDVVQGAVVIFSNDAQTGQPYLLTEETEVKLRFGAVPEFITGYLDDNELSHAVVERPGDFVPGAPARGIDILDGFLLLLTPLTAMFLHAGLFHLVGNMLFLWVFGDNVEDRLGHGRFLVFYLATGYAAAAAHIFIDSSDLVPMIGASGAISGVLGAYLLLFPRAMVQVLIPVILFIPAVIPAPIMIGFWFVLNAIPGVGSVLADASGSGTAWWAHIGGFVAGVCLIYPFLVGRWRAPVQEIGPTWNVPHSFGFGFRFRHRALRRDEIPSGRDPRVDPPLPDPPAAHPSPAIDARLPADWDLITPSPVPADRRRWRLPRLRRRHGPGGVDAFRDPPDR